LYYQLTNASKRKIVELLKSFFVNHGRFNDVVIQTNYTVEERPKYSIIVRSSSASFSPQSLDNQIGTFTDSVSLANFEGIQGNSILWAISDENHKDNLAPSGYYVVIIDDLTHFHIESYLIINSELLTKYEDNGIFYSNLLHTNVNVGSEIIYTTFGPRLVRGYHYTIDNTLGKITFLRDASSYGDLKIYYEYIIAPSNLIEFKEEESNNTAINGVTIAFSDDIKIGDQQVIIVDQDQKFAYNSYGGQWELQFELLITAQDQDYAERLTDLTAIEIMRHIDELSDSGFSIQRDISFSGESAEEEDTNAGDYSYSNSITFSAKVDWELRIPITKRLTAIEFENVKNDVSDEIYAEMQTNNNIGDYEISWREQENDLNEEYVPTKGITNIKGLKMVYNINPFLISI
jgi:hypothetical protein